MGLEKSLRGAIIDENTVEIERAVHPSPASEPEATDAPGPEEAAPQADTALPLPHRQARRHPRGQGQGVRQQAHTPRGAAGQERAARGRRGER